MRTPEFCVLCFIAIAGVLTLIFFVIPYLVGKLS